MRILGAALLVLFLVYSLVRPILESKISSDFSSDPNFEQLAKLYLDLSPETLLSRTYPNYLKPDDHEGSISPLKQELLDRLFMLYNPDYSFQDIFQNPVFPQDKIDSLLPVFAKFRDSIELFKTKQFKPHTETSPALNKPNVTILTADCGGGHMSAARSIAQKIESRYSVKLLNLSKLKREYANSLNSLLIAKKLYKMRTDHVISTVPHAHLLKEATHLLNIPLSIMLTDYTFPPDLNISGLELGHAKLIKYWLPTTENHLVHFLKDNSKGSTCQELRRAAKQDLLAEFIAQNPNLQLTGYPVHNEFYEPVSLQGRKRFNQKFGITMDPHTKVISLSFGSLPIECEYEKVLKKLLRPENKFFEKIQLVILTGKNKDLLKSLPELLSKLQKAMPVEAQNRFSTVVLPFLNYPEEIAHLYKISDLVLSKAGGATTAELIASQSKTLRAFSLWPWEIPNSMELRSQGLTVKMKSSYESEPTQIELVQAINDLLHSPKSKQPQKQNDFWQQAIL